MPVKGGGHSKTIFAILSGLTQKESTYMKAVDVGLRHVPSITKLMGWKHLVWCSNYKLTHRLTSFY